MQYYLLVNKIIKPFLKIKFRNEIKFKLQKSKEEFKT